MPRNLKATTMNRLKSGKLGKPRSLAEFVFYIDVNFIQQYVAKNIQAAERAGKDATFQFINFEAGLSAEDKGPPSIILDYACKGYTVVTASNFIDFNELSVKLAEKQHRKNELKKLRKLQGSAYKPLKRGPKNE